MWGGMMVALGLCMIAVARGDGGSDPRVWMELGGGVTLGGAGAVLGASIAGVALEGTPSAGLVPRGDWQADTLLVGAGWLVGGTLGAAYGVHGVRRVLLGRTDPVFGRLIGGAILGGAVGVALAGAGLVVADGAPRGVVGSFAVGAIAGPVLGTVIAAEVPADASLTVWAAPRPGGGAILAAARF